MLSTRPLVLLLTVLIAACATGSSSSKEDSTGEGGGVSVGQKIPALKFQALEDGGPTDLASLHGKVVLLDIWASWCAPCKEEMPLLNDLAQRLADKSIAVVAVSIDEDRASAQAFLRTRKKWALSVGHDPTGKVAEILSPPKMPTSYVIDARGTLRHINAGFERGDIKKLEDHLLSLAKAK